MTVEIDDSLYSRQTYVLGKEAMARLLSSSVLVTGLTGVGVEVAKNLLLAGVSRCVIHDDSPIFESDLSGNFYATPADVGAPRAATVHGRLAELNSACNLSVANGDLTDELVRSVGVVVLCDLRGDTAAVAKLCRQAGTALVVAQAAGLAARCFCDFGDDFVVSDATGEEPSFSVVRAVMEEVSSQLPARDVAAHKLVVVTDGPHNLGDGDTVDISDLRGTGALINSVNNARRKVTVVNATMLEINLTVEDAAALAAAPEDEINSSYVRGGFIRQVKLPETVSFMSYADAITMPPMAGGLALTSYDIERLNAVHYTLLALEADIEAGQTVAPWSQGDAQRIAETAVGLGGDADARSDDVYRTLACASRGVFSPLCAVLGGFAAQQAMIALTGKFSPLRQWAVWDGLSVLECLDNSHSLGSPTSPLHKVLDPAATAPAAAPRVAGQALCLGTAFCDAAAHGSWFLVGAGALGCEYLKQFALMGIATETGATVTVTDNDNIERSNLSRQFLFRAGDVGQAKSEVAAGAARVINPDMNLRALTVRVGLDTVNVLNPAFYDALRQPTLAPAPGETPFPAGGVVNALDNVQARMFMDGRCVAYGLPLIEAGTLGSKANCQIIVPGLTENYGASADPEEDSIPMCTLHNFPSKIDHTIMYATDLFSGIFTRDPAALHDFAAAVTADEWARKISADATTALDTARMVRRSLRAVAEVGATNGGRPGCYEDCVALARVLFEEEFASRMKQLLHNTPLDHVDESGMPFWSGSKRPPTPAQFSPDNADHVAFINAAARIIARLWRLDVTLSPTEAAQMAARLRLPAWAPKSGDDTETFAQVVDELRPWFDGADRTFLPLAGEEFEKDCDANSHVAFVTAASNIRAACYDIPPADFAETKRIAGRIIPAMITTTALIVGYGGLEHAKLIAERAALVTEKGLRTPAQRLERYANTFVNIGIPIFSSTEPTAAKITPLYEDADANAAAAAAGVPTQFSIWNTLKMNCSRHAPLSVVMEWLNGRFGASVSIATICFGTKTLYDDMMFDGARKTKRLGQALVDILAEVGEPIGDDTTGIELGVLGEHPETYDEARMPTLQVEFTD